MAPYYLPGITVWFNYIHFQMNLSIFSNSGKIAFRFTHTHFNYESAQGVSNAHSYHYFACYLYDRL